jgi:acyl-CoA synthetase (AMP-forming)/AMP-acid ligase II
MAKLMTGASQPTLKLEKPKTLGESFVAAAKLRISRPFFIDAEMRLDGAQVLGQSKQLAAALQTQALSSGDKIVFLSRPSVLHTLAWFSAIRLGAIATNLHLLETPERMAETIAWLEAKLVVFDEEFSALAQPLSEKLPQVRFVPLADLSRTQAELTSALDAGESSDPVAIVLSSGSTGRPKGVIHTHASVLGSVEAGGQVYRGLDMDDSVLVCIGTSFGGWCNVVLPFVGLATRLVFQRRFDPQAFLKGLADERITIAPLVPTMWRMVLATEPERYDLSSVKLAFMSGEMASRSDVEQIRARVTGKVRAAYLSTEGACGCGIVADEDQFQTETRPAGRLIAGADIRIIATNGTISDLLPAGQTGEILLSGKSLACGYWKDADRTTQRFNDGWWRSGDTGYLTEDGRVVLVGRTDHVINSGGMKIQAEEIEAALMCHPKIRQAAVVGVPDPKWGQRAEAYVIVSDDGADAQSISSWCQTEGQISPMRFLKAVHVVERLPTGPTGKLYRPALLAPQRNSA